MLYFVNILTKYENRGNVGNIWDYDIEYNCVKGRLSCNNENWNLMLEIDCPCQ